MFFKVILPILLCFIPLIAGILIFALGLKNKPMHLVIAVLLGLAAVLPISIIQFFIPETSFLSSYPLLKSLLKSLFLYGFIEEALKAALIIPIPRKDKTVLEILCLAFTFGLTLGCFESVVYYLDHLQLAANRGATLLYGSIFVRIFTSDIIHLTCAGLGGLFIYSCSIKKTMVTSLLVAIILHGLYDFFAGFQNGLRFFAIPVILLAIAECRIKYSSLKNVEE